MPNINLLPWREKKREEEKKQFYVVLGMGIFIAMGIAYLINMYANQLIDNQNQRNQVLTNEIATLDKQIKEIKALQMLRSALITRMNIIHNLQSTRSLTVRLFDELVNIMPKGVYLTKLERQNNKVLVFGYAESNTNISSLMRNIKSSQWINNPELTEIKRIQEESEDGAAKTFKLSFDMVIPNKLANE